MNDRAIRVVKLGGSLLELPDLAARLRSWLGGQTTMSSAVVVGGGRMADVVRELQRLHALDEDASHWLAVRAMQTNAQFVAALLSEAAWPVTLNELAEEPPPLSIVDPWCLMRDDDRRDSPRPLPASWQVTSDSIAARLAKLCGAVELVLLKSALPDSGDLHAAASAGYVDAFFPQAVTLARVRCVNLRDERFAEVALLVPIG